MTSSVASSDRDNLRPVHIVQVGFDDTVFQVSAPSDTLRRQQAYARELERSRPGSGLTVVMLINNAAARPIIEAGLQILPLAAKRIWRWPAFFRLLQRLHSSRPIDVITTQTISTDAWVALLFGFRHDVPVVGQVHYDLFSPIARRETLGPGIIGTLRHAMSLRLLRRMAAVRVVARGLQKNLRAEGVRNVEIIPVPISMVRNPNDVPDAAAEPLGHARESRVLFVGRLVPPKNLWLWLLVAQQVAQQAPTAVFEIVGDGPLRKELEEEARRLGLDRCVSFTGAVPYEELGPIYCRASVFLLTSHYEGFGRVVVEAALHGLPVVAPRISGVEDIVVDSVTGFLHPPGQVEALAASTVLLLKDHSRRIEMGRQGQALVTERFDPHRLTREWVGLLVRAAEDR
jgi:glycosyltransferase involved in cell wall biosynthesis